MLLGDGAEHGKKRELLAFNQQTQFDRKVGDACVVLYTEQTIAATDLFWKRSPPWYLVGVGGGVVGPSQPVAPRVRLTFVVPFHASLDVGASTEAAKCVTDIVKTDFRGTTYAANRDLAARATTFGSDEVEVALAYTPGVDRVTKLVVRVDAQQLPAMLAAAIPLVRKLRIENGKVVSEKSPQNLRLDRLPPQYHRPKHPRNTRTTDPGSDIGTAAMPVQGRRRGSSG